MIALTELTPLILPFVRDCSTPAAIVAARFAAIEFYKQTLWQQEMLEPLDIYADTSIYEIETPPNTVPSQVMRAELGDVNADGTTSEVFRGRVLEFRTKDQLDHMYGTGWTTMTGTPAYITQVEPDQIILVPCPDTTVSNVLRLMVAVQPTPDAVEIDDSVFNYYAEPLAYGARARLVETAGQPYYDPTAAPMLWGRFYGGVSEAKARRMREHTRAVQHVQLRRWV